LSEISDDVDGDAWYFLDMNERNKKPHPSLIHVNFSDKIPQNIKRAFYNLPTEQNKLLT
jgi:hypothetical protein